MRRSGTSHTPIDTMYASCKWDETYSVVPANLECILKFCGHPHDYPTGTHPPPPTGNNLALVRPSYSSYWSVNSWRKSFGANIQYKCTGTKFFELPEPPVKTPYKKILEVTCLNTGIYSTPPRNSKVWPNCTQTVLCGQPQLPNAAMTVLKVDQV